MSPLNFFVSSLTESIQAEGDRRFRDRFRSARSVAADDLPSCLRELTEPDDADPIGARDEVG